MIMTKEQKRNAEEITNSSTFISKGTSMEGNIETSGNIRIEGKLTGNIRSKAKVALGPVSSIQGDIVAQNADIEGEVNGKIEISDMLTLKATAIIKGDISTGKLVVEAGATFIGNCMMGAGRNLKIIENGTIRISEEAKTA